MPANRPYGDNARAQRLAYTALAEHRAVEAAIARRGRYLALALDAGCSTRELSELLGVGYSTPARWAREARSGS